MHVPCLKRPPIAAALAAGVTGTLAALGQQASPAALIPRFDRGANPIALSGPARPSRYMEASGRRAAFLGREDGSLEAWVYPLKVLHDFNLSFQVAAYADPIPGASLAASVDVRPESSTVRYAHPSFTVDATWFVPIDVAGGLVLLDVHASEAISVVVKFRIDLKPMWPAALGGQYSYWDDDLKAYVAGEASRKHSALVGSPLALTPPEQPAHNLPDASSQFAIRITPEDADRGIVPIVITASPDGIKAARAAYDRLQASTEPLYRETVAHYRQVREGLTSVETPDRRIDLALEWGKVALDKGFVCNPHLGCGLIAGLGPSGVTERPGFGWFFGGDAFVNAWAMTAYGDFPTVKASLEFLRRRQRADGKMMHELSQGANYIRWFEEYPYGYYHADTTPLYIVAVRDFVTASGDQAMARDFWPSIRKAFDYCMSTDEDGDGLMDNTRAGLAAVETGKLRSRDVLTDVFLGAVWTEAAAGAADLASIADPPFASTARAAADKARASLNRRFLDDGNRRVNFAVMKDGSGQAELTVWPAFGIWRGVFDESRPAVAGMLDQLAGAGVGTDWGARMLSRESELYEPLSYNNGAVWPFLTEFAALALYRSHRAPAAWAYLDGTADLTFLEARGYIAELFSGDRLRSIDAAVPHQLFATTGYVSTLLRGLLGIGTAERAPRESNSAASARMRLAPQLPSGWRQLRVRNLRWRGAIFDFSLERTLDMTTITVAPRSGTVPLSLEIVLPPGAEPISSTASRRFVQVEGDPGRGARLRLDADIDKLETIQLRHRPGIEVATVNEPLQLGDESRRLRIIDARLDGDTYTVSLQGRSGRTYRLNIDLPFEVESLDGAREVGRDGSRRTLEVAFSASPEHWQESTLRVRLGRRRGNAQ
ncbi:MAG TPA: glycosyl hydrolase family 65 protein [Vicinamibacterales bacterium]|nr:glycosyl hydrolase family 65 protein [Vicinamibacterales bacterium]